MSNDKVRAEFEAAITKDRMDAGYDEPNLRMHEWEGSQCYNETHVQAAWWGWQASRAALAPAAKPRLTGANGGEFKFVLKWDGVDSHPYLEILNGVFDMAGKNHISDLLIAVSDWISEYAESIRTQPTRTGIIEAAGVRVKP